ncbi:MAG: SCP2 sterol-binding domain-containing protein [Deltaproteobacteria bacterium]|nr:SCP2 sterol-binding domain-containing protein [Deltaproteobacteria bacterium]
MSSAAELIQAANSFRDLMNDNPRIQKLLKRWSPTLHFTATDDAAARLSLRIDGGKAGPAEEGHQGRCDLEVLGTAQDLGDMFRGRMNPTQKYLNGEIRVKGHQADIIKLDAITMIIWPEE